MDVTVNIRCFLIFLLIGNLIYMGIFIILGRRKQPNSAIPEHFKFYQNPLSRKMTQQNRMLIKNISARFAREMRTANVTYLLYSGSLLGSYRHEDIVPWDDDVDVIIPDRQKEVLYSALSILKPDFILNTDMIIRWKFYSFLSKPIKDKSWKWPFLDISFYLENDTHIWDSDEYWEVNLYNKSIVFPLKEGIFMGLRLPIPRDPYAVLSVSMDVNMCVSNSFDHRLEESVPSHLIKTIPCFKLKQYYFFTKNATKGWNKTVEIKSP